MYATVRIYSEAEGLAGAVAEHKAEIVALLRGIDGFRSYYTGQDRAGERRFHLGLRRSSRGRGLDPGVAHWIASNLTDLSISTPQVLVGEVAMDA